MHIANSPNREAVVGLSTSSRASSGELYTEEKVRKIALALIDPAALP